MILGQVDITTIIVVLAYMVLVLFLGWLGFRRTKSSTDYLLAGRQIHPFVMALSYGATFISTSAIVGFGGVAGLFGMSVLWLTVLNIFVGIFIAFVFLGGPTRKMGRHLDAHTFPELLGRRFQSKFVQIFAGLIIFLFIPLYASAVMIGGCEFIEEALGIDYNAALLIFSIIIAAYVVVGGLKGVMYSDALQGAIMFVGMTILLAYTYIKLGGVTESHQALTDLAPMVPGKLAAMGHKGWTAMPEFGWGDPKYSLWWIVVSTIVMGVGIGVLAQPQLAVRFMTVKSKKELNHAVPVGGLFILVMTGVAFTVGALSNVYSVREGGLLKGRIVKELNSERNQVVIQLMKEENGVWADVPEKMAPVVIDGDAVGEAVVGDKLVPVVQGRSISIVYAAGNAGKVIPNYITGAMPKWFGLVFLLTLLAAAMSTLSSQFHAVGTSIGRDVYEQIHKNTTNGVTITRLGIVIGIVIAVLWSYFTRGGTIIATATALFFGLCASTFLPAFVGGLFFKKATKAGAISSMVIGFSITAFWLLFVKAKEAGALGLVQKVADGKNSLLADYPNWAEVDSLFVALPVSLLVMIVVSLITKKPDNEHLNKCFKK